MIEEIDSDAFNKHYLDKVFRELGSSPRAFLAAALDFVAQESPAFFRQPGAADTVAQLVQQHLPAAGAAAGGTEAPEAAAAPAAAPAAQQQQQQQQQQQPGSAAADVPPPQQQQPEAQQASSSGPLKPNDGNGADLGRYSWTQTLGEVVVQARLLWLAAGEVPVPPGTKGRACDVSIGRDRLRVGLKGQPPVLDGPLFAGVQPDECLWNLVDGRSLELTLQKRDGMQWWRSVVQGEPEIDVQAVEPEPSKLTDLDPEMRATVEKMMYDQRQKAMGLPSSEEQQREAIMKQFMAAHPEMDFSNAKIDLGGGGGAMF